ALRLPGLRSPAATLLRVATRQASTAPWHGGGAVRFACPGYAVGTPDKAVGRIRIGSRRRPVSMRRRSPERVSRVRFAYPGYAVRRRLCCAWRRVMPRQRPGTAGARCASLTRATQPGGDSAARGDAPGLAGALA